MTTALLLGWLIGMRHALEADHVAAVATLVVRSNSLQASIRQGACWGVGHMLTLLAVGSVVVLSGAAVWSGLAPLLQVCVGAMLVLLGLDMARHMIADRSHFHIHSHRDGRQNVHAAGQDSRRHDHLHARGDWRRALFIGLMHGLAGSGVLVMLALESSQSVPQAIFYMLMFGLGSVAGMAALSAAIAVPLRRSGKGSTWFNRGVEVVVGAANLSLGAYLVHGALTATT